MAAVTKIESQAKRSEIIKLRYQGHTLARVAEMVGLAGPSSVQHHEQAWLAEQRPSAEVTEARRQMQLAGIDAVRARLFGLLESEPEVPVRLAVVDRIAKLWEREARLVGLDLERSVQVNVLPTAEQLASVFGWDAPGGVIEGTAVELDAGADGGEA